MNKSEAVNVWLVMTDACGLIKSKSLIATFRNENWAKAFIEMEKKDRPEAYSEYMYLEIKKKGA